MRKAIVIAALLALIAVVAIIAIGTRWSDPNGATRPAKKGHTQQSPFVIPKSDKQTVVVGVDDLATRVKELCSTCHVLPTPDVEPKELWPGKIREMYQYMQGPRPVAPKRMPPIDDVIEYWTFRAPKLLQVPDDAIGSPQSPQAFQRRMIKLDVVPDPPSISSVGFVRLADDGPSQLLICDMRNGLVVLWTPSQPGQTATIIARIAHPSRPHVVDLDGDGLRDILVANLGEYWPVDTTKGSVVWLRNRGEGQFETVVLMGGFGRVNEVQPADFDGDGDLDIVVADFGNLTTGRIVYLENFTEDYSQPYFEAASIEETSGTSDVPVVDLNGDGHPDFLALQSQEKEHVIAFLNRGWGNFTPKMVYKAPHPRWGSTGIRLIDMDGDGDIDVLWNHGDSVQLPPIPRPYHGLSWLENRGSFPFTHHHLSVLPGAHTSLPADLDGDGDLDLVSSVFIPAFDPDWPNAETLDTVVWLQQTSPGKYERYSLETSTPFHPCGDLGDYDGDGDIDIVLGNFCMFPSDYYPWEACITVFENSLVTAEDSSEVDPDTEPKKFEMRSTKY